MYQLYILEHVAADERAQVLHEAEQARLLRQVRAYRSPVARLQAWWNLLASITTDRSIEQPIAR